MGPFVYGWNISRSQNIRYLDYEHASRWYLHVVPKFEIYKEEDGLPHADMPEHLHCLVCYWISREQVAS